MNTERVWLERRQGRRGPVYYLRWHDATTGKVKAKSTKTADKRRADTLRSAKLEELREGGSGEVHKTTWPAFVETVLARLSVAKAATTVSDVQTTVVAFTAVVRPGSRRAVKSGDILRFRRAKEKGGSMTMGHRKSLPDKNLANEADGNRTRNHRIDSPACRT